MNIKLTKKQEELLKSLGFKDDEITPENLINAKLYAEALNGSVSAANSIKQILSKTDDVEESIDDLSSEVKKEEKKIIATLKGLSKDIIEVNKELIHNIAFQAVQLRHLSDYIATHGVKEKYKNGNNQWGYKDRTEVKTYNNMMKSYQSCMKQLNDLLSNNCSSSSSFEDDDLSDD